MVSHGVPLEPDTEGSARLCGGWVGSEQWWGQVVYQDSSKSDQGVTAHPATARMSGDGGVCGGCGDELSLGERMARQVGHCPPCLRGTMPNY